MANEEKRITARMILDSSGFNASLSGVNNSLRVAKSELQNASAQVGVFGRDSERLKEVQEALARQVQLHTQRVGIYTQSLKTSTARMATNIKERDRLRSSLATANTAYAEAVRLHGKESAEAEYVRQGVVGITSALKKSEAAVITNARQVNNYTTNLNNARAELTRVQGELNRSSAEIADQESRWLSASRTLTTASDQMRAAGRKASQAGQSLTVGVTMPIVGVGIAAIRTGMEFEAQMSRVKAISGATGDEFKLLNDQALQLGALTSFSSSQAAQGMENLVSAGFSVNETMAAMSGVLDLAASGGVEIAVASEIAAGALRGFALDASKSGHVADVLAKAAGDTNAGVTDMGEALKYAAPPAKALGVSLETTAAAVGILSNANIKGEMAGTMLRSSLVALTSPSKEAAATMKDLGFNAFDAQGKMLPFNQVIDNLKNSTKDLSDEKKADAIATIFGKEALSGMLVLMEAGGGKIDTLTKSFQGSDGAATAMAKTMKENVKGSVDEMKGSIETASIKLSTVMAPSITAVAKSVTNLANKFSELSPETQETIIKSLALAAALGPVLLVGGKIVGAVGVITKGMAAVSGIMGLTSIAAAGTGAAVAGTGTAVGTMGAGAAAAALLLNPITLGLGAFGLAAVGVNSIMSQKVIPTIDLFGNGVSEATKKSVGAYMEMDNKVGVSLESFRLMNTRITKEIATDMVGTFEKMGADIKAGRDKHYTEDLANLTKFYTDQGTIDSAEVQATLAEMKETHISKGTEIDAYEAKIKAIYDKAAADHKTLTQQEEDEIKAIKDKMQALALQALTDSEKEQAAILTRMRLQAGDISTKQAGEVIANSAKQRDETTRLANDQYEKTVASIARQRDEGVITSDDQAKKMIAAAELTRSEALRKAEAMHKEVVAELERENVDVGKKIDAQDGSIKTGWRSLGEWFANNPLRRWLITRTRTENTAAPKTYHVSGYDDSGQPILEESASGTNYFRGGLTTMHEKGYEVYNLPRGSKIYNHEASEDMVLKTAQEVARGVLSSMQTQSQPGESSQTIQVNLKIDSSIISQHLFRLQQSRLHSLGVPG